MYARLGGRLAIIAALLGVMIPMRAPAACLGPSLDREIGQTVMIFAGTVARVSPDRLPGGRIITHYLFTDVVFAKGSASSDSVILTSRGGVIGTVKWMSEDCRTFDQGKRYIVFGERGGPCSEPGYGMAPRFCFSGFLVEADSTAHAPVVYAYPGTPVIAFRDWHMVVRGAPWTLQAPGIVYRDAAGHGGPWRPPDLAPWTWARRDTTIDEYGSHTSTKSASSNSRFVRTEFVWRQRDPGTRVSEAEFLEQIRAIVREQTAADSVGATPAIRPRGTAPPAVESTPPQPPVRVRPVPGAK
jgi:hypothetical protein